VTCREFADFVIDYFEGRLDADARARFDRHLTLCPDCVHYLRQYRDTIQAGEMAFDDEVAVSVPDDLLQAILAAKDA
jgi:anti-sigma factor RsiW